MIDVIFASMATALIVSFLTFLMSVVAFRRNLATRTEIMGLRKEIAILAGTLEAHFQCNPTRPDDDKTKTEMAKLGKPPEIAFSYETPSYNNFQKKLSLNMHTEYDKPSVRTHEFTHWWHYQIQRKYPEIREELKAAAAKDFERIKKMYSANKADYRFSNQSALDKIAKNMFRVEKWDSLTKEEQNSAKNFFNSVGSISSGKFGGMHGKTAETIDDPKENKAYFTDQNTNKNRIAFGEVIAELGEEENNPDGKLRLAFKETWAIFQKYRNMR